VTEEKSHYNTISYDSNNKCKSQTYICRAKQAIQTNWR
jgi:hypothetical protein